MSFWDWLPFYAHLKFAGLVGCAFFASYVGALALFFASFAAKKRFGLYRSLSLGLLFGSILWLMPYGFVIYFEVSESYVGLINILIISIFYITIKFESAKTWNESLIIISFYTISQIILLLTIDFYLLK